MSALIAFDTILQKKLADIRRIVPELDTALSMNLLRQILKEPVNIGNRLTSAPMCTEPSEALRL